VANKPEAELGSWCPREISTFRNKSMPSYSRIHATPPPQMHMHIPNEMHTVSFRERTVNLSGTHGAELE